jgi:protein-S-isoprenylcysteine O-methyltransferase Ste14
MTEPTIIEESGRNRQLVLRTVQGATTALLGNCLVLFVVAGRIDLPMFWLYVVLRFVLALAFGLINWLRDPSLYAERAQASKRGGGNDSRAWRMINRGLPFLILIVAGLDVGHFHWTDTVPFPLQIVGVLGTVFGTLIVAWAMRENTFFSTIVRIQKDRGQRVITSGPYRFVRHPGYLGMLLRFTFSSLILGSWAAVAVATLFMPVYMVRIKKEEPVLLDQLEGYRGYAARVRYRMIPVLW